MYVNNEGKPYELNGYLCDIYELPKIKLTSRGSTFPYYNTPNYNSGYIRVISAVQNTIYIDFGDGSEIYERDFINTLQLHTSNPIHTYTDGLSLHNITIWFKDPSKITNITFYIVALGGNFPEAISYYNLKHFESSLTAFNDFPVDFPPSIFETLHFSDATVNEINYIPLWLTKSKISHLKLGQKITLSNPLVSNIDKLINISGLTSLSFIDGNMLNDVAPNFKDIPSLKYLAIGGEQNLTNITKNINDCKQLSHLSIGYTSHPLFGSTTSPITNLFTSWGYGIVGMSNLEALYMGGTKGFTTDAILGLESAPLLKTLYFRGTYNTQTRQDTFITNLYNQVINIASKTLGNTIMRQVRLEVCWILSGGVAIRPLGNYQQPEGYIQGTSNGNPETPMEMIWVLVKQYRWTVLINNTALNGIETIAP